MAFAASSSSVGVPSKFVLSSRGRSSGLFQGMSELLTVCMFLQIILTAGDLDVSGRCIVQSIVPILIFV